VARDRKRAKQRQQRRAKTGALPSESHIRHENVPGALEHASGEVEEFDAALVDGAGGELAGDRGAAGDGGDERDLAERADLEMDAAEGSGNGDAAVQEEPQTHTVTRTLTAASVPSRPARGEGENRVLAFLRASWSELQRVQWPDRRQVAQATAVVLGFVAIAGAYLGVADWLAGKIVDAIL
jgi:preprotein translocase SecE subunit